MDSTGLKIYGAGEWNSRKSKKRRGWRKLHIGVDGDGYIVAGVLTDREADDATTAEPMIEGLNKLICNLWKTRTDKVSGGTALILLNRIQWWRANRSAKIAERKGKYQEAFRHYNRALERAAKLPVSHRGGLTTFTALLKLYCRAGRYEEALRVGQRIFFILEARPDPARADTADALGDLGDLALDSSDLETANLAYEHAVEILRSVNRRSIAMGRTLKELKEGATRAASLTQEARFLLKTAASAPAHILELIKHTGLFQPLSEKLILIYRLTGRLEEAIALRRETIQFKMAHPLFGEGNTAGELESMLVLMREAGVQTGEALSYAEKYLSLLEARSEPEANRLLSPLSHLVTLNLKMENYASAAVAADRGNKIVVAASSRRSKSALSWTLFRAEAYFGLGEEPEAIELVREVVQLAGPNRSNTRKQYHKALELEAKFALLQKIKSEAEPE